MKPGIPMIFFHLGDSYYLQYTFNQLLQSNPNSDIYLIGDNANKHYESLGIKHVDCKLYEKTAKQFEKIYVHLSCMRGFVERICFQRWMYIRDFVIDAGITGRFCCLDSDVLVYGDITDYHDKYCGGYDVTLHGKYGPGCNVFKNVDILTKLVDNTFKYYSTPELLEKLKTSYVTTHKNITDMKMIDAFVDECGVNAYDLLQINDGLTFDSHIAKMDDTRFEISGKFKKIIFRNKIPYCIRTDNSQTVMMMILHIQGHYKRYMYRYYTGDKSKVEKKLCAVINMCYQTAKLMLYRIFVLLGKKTR